MGDEEKRRIRASALLELEEAKEHLALLRVKLDSWRRIHEMVYHLLVRGRREGAQMEGSAAQARAAVERHRSEIVEVLNLDDVCALDDELRDAIARVKRAEEAKKSLGFS